MTKIKRRFCPYCGSPNVEWSLPQDWSRWICKNCGYIGALIIDDQEMAQKIQKDYQKKSY